MFTTLAQTFFHASGVSPTRFRKDIGRSWYREDMLPPARPKRWEDWK